MSQGGLEEAETPSFYPEKGTGHLHPNGGQARAPSSPCPPLTGSLLTGTPSAPPAKGRAILLPMDLDAHISSLLSSGASCAAAAQRSASSYKAATRAFPRVTPTANQWDYKNIIEKLQVGVGLPGSAGRASSRPGRGHQLISSPGLLGAGDHSRVGAAKGRDTPHSRQHLVFR